MAEAFTCALQDCRSYIFSVFRYCEETLIVYMNTLICYLIIIMVKIIITIWEAQNDAYRM